MTIYTRSEKEVTVVGGDLESGEIDTIDVYYGDPMELHKGRISDFYADGGYAEIEAAIEKANNNV